MIPKSFLNQNPHLFESIYNKEEEFNNFNNLRSNTTDKQNININRLNTQDSLGYNNYNNSANKNGYLKDNQNYNTD